MSWYNPTTWGASEVKSGTKVLGLSPELGSFLLAGADGFITPSRAFSLYNQTTAVSVPVNMIARAFAALELVLENNGVVTREHPVLDLLRVPSPFYTGELLREVLALNYLIAGETELIALGRINRPPTSLQPISPADVTVVEGQQGVPSQILVSGNTLAGSYKPERKGNRIRYIQNNMLELEQIRGYSTRNNSLLNGQSPLVSASNEARQSIEGNRHNVSLLQNGGRLSLVFNFEEDMSADDFEAVKQSITDKFAGSVRAGTILTTSGGKLKVEEMGVNNKDMDYFNLQKTAREACALQWNVPLPLISQDASTFNNYREAKLALFDDAVLPLAGRIFAGFDDLLLPRYGLDPAQWSIIPDIDKVPALLLRRNEQLKLRKELNVESDNELRETLGKEPYEGGDVILKPANLVPIGTDLFTEPTEPGLFSDLDDE